MLKPKPIQYVFVSHMSNLCAEITTYYVSDSCDTFDELIKKSYYNDIKSIYCRKMELTEIPYLPNRLIELYCKGNKLTRLPQLPDNLLYMNCSDNQLTILPKLPKSLVCLWVSWNKLKELPRLPDYINIFGCEHNYITTVPFLPDSLTYFYFVGFNPISDFITNNFGSWIKYRKYQNLMLKVNANIIGEWFAKCRMNPKYKYCRDRLMEEFKELYDTS